MPAQSVRSRLTISVTLIVGAIAIATALIAPRIVRSALVDDLLDAESSEVGEDPTTQFGEAITFFTSELSDEELTDLFAPEISDLTNALDGTSANAELRSFRDDDLLVVVPAPDIAGTVDVDGAVTVKHVDLTTAGPVITTGQLEAIALELEIDWFTFGPFEALFESGENWLEILGGFEVFQDSDPFEDFDSFFDEDGLTLDSLPFDIEQLFDQGIVPSIGETPSFPPDGPKDQQKDDDEEPVPELTYGLRSVDQVELIVAAPTESVDLSVERLTTVLWLAAPLLMLLVGLATWLITSHALRPVAAITRRTATIKGGDLHERVPVPKAADEIADLANEVNELLARLQREDGRRRQFVSDASHELRSPIAALQTQAEASLATDTEPSTTALAAGVLAEAERLGVVVADLLALARHDEGLAPPGSILDLDDIVLIEAARPRRIPIDTTAVSAGQVRGRADEMTRVTAHLLENAVRHARSQVAVALTTEGDRVRLVVDDDGPGIPAAERSRVFERFVRLEAARERDTGGAGLGLAVVASVVNAANGTASVAESELGGARLVVDLPAAH